MIKTFTTLMVVVLLMISCKKEVKQAEVEYQLETSSPTGDHFDLTYVNELNDTLTHHEHPGWKYAFKTNTPYNAYIKADVHPIDSYTFTIKILVNGEVVQQASANTNSGAHTTIKINHTVK